MLNSGCFSLPYAWKLGGLWVSLYFFKILIITIEFSDVFCSYHFYSGSKLVRKSYPCAIISVFSQKVSFLSKLLSNDNFRTERAALDYGHFTKKVCDNSHISFLKNNSKTWMGVVNVTILFCMSFPLQVLY